MDNEDLWNIALDICKKEGKGMAVDPYSWGYYLDWGQKKYYELEFSKYEQTRRVGDSLLPFLREETLESTDLDLPTDYGHLIGAEITWDDDTSDVADIVTYPEYLERKGNNLLEPTEDDPVVYLTSEEDEYGAITSSINISPSGYDSVDIVYLKTPATCVFDYYIDDEGEVVYLDPNTSYTLQTDEEYRDGTASGAVDSISSELEWNDMDKLKILEMALIKIGVKLENNAIMQYAGMLDQVNKAQP